MLIKWRDKSLKYGKVELLSIQKSQVDLVSFITLELFSVKILRNKSNSLFI